MAQFRKAIAFATLASTVLGARVVLEQAEASKQGDICVVTGPAGSGLSAAIEYPNGKCFIPCRNMAMSKTDQNRLMEGAFEAASQAGDKCACTTTSAVNLVGGDGKISWEEPNVPSAKCTPAKCWESYKGAYDVGRSRKLMLKSVSNYNGKCSSNDGSKQGGTFTLGTAVFYHVKRQAAKKDDSSQVAKLVQEANEDDVDEEELIVEDDTTLQEVLDHDFGLGATSTENIKKAAEIIDTEVNVVEDPWTGWAHYLGFIGKACNVGISDFEALQSVKDWTLEPSKMFNAKVCEADELACMNSLDEYPGLQADGCDDDECRDAMDKIMRLFVSFGHCKAMKHGGYDDKPIRLD